MNRSEFFTRIADQLTSDELRYVQKAYWLVKEIHRLQERRLTGERYFEHVRRVSWLAAVQYGFCDGETIALGLLHDSVEDTFVPQDVLVSLFGQEMYNWILVLFKEIPSFHAVTGEMLGRVKLETKVYYEQLLAADRKPRIIKCCDRLDNLADLGQWEEPRRAKYIKETQDWSLPLAYKTDLRITADIEHILADIEHILEAEKTF